MSSRTRSRKPASIGSNHSSRRPTPISASEPRTGNFVLLVVMAWSPPAHNAGSFGFQHPETTPPLIPTTLRTAPPSRHCPGPRQSSAQQFFLASVTHLTLLGRSRRLL